ncbi:hypothetical protein ID144_00830 [Pseudomonas sp. JM0905a]|uniref:hypothetical protein n=1 Tax=Pseudomonas sp. JM0905a TaxID=2772484 RepID=UPI00168298CA|nr:hypothetical protein [Pseudomonas sp. JM0905a]MBD2835581.1 hypothetical protein [Pseudomonas sp. JM0905a]
MKNLEEARVAEVEMQLAFCFEQVEFREQPCLPRPSLIEPLAVMSLGPNKVVSFPTPKRSSIEATLLARILQRSRHFK